MQKMLDRMSNSRQPFDLVVQPGIMDLKSFRIKGQGRFPPILSFLIIGSSIGLFAYVNTFFLIKMSDVINGSVYNKTTEVFSCDFYFCDKTAFNFINYYSNYVQCNTKICQDVVCSGYNCSDISGYNINQYYACEGKCGNTIESLPPPSIVTNSFIISMIAGCLFGIGMIISFFYGIFTAICTTQLSPLERAGLILSFTWPKLKYFAFRKRINWDGFYFDLRCMIFVDLFVNLFYAMTLAIYIYLQIKQLWQTNLEIACYYMLILASLTRVSIMGEITGPFMNANRQLNALRINSIR